MKRFLFIWAGQLFSIVGSGLTAFSIAVWSYLTTGEMVDLALIAGAAYLPNVLIAPIGGILADRLDRQRLMILADSGAAIVTGVIFWGVHTGVLVPWSAALLVFLSSSCGAMQWPAYEAAIVDMVPKAHLGRANGLCELSRGMSQLISPLAAGALFGVIGLRGIILVDLASFVVGVFPLLVVRIPKRVSAETKESISARTMLSDLRAAWDFVAKRPGLIAMLLLFFVTNFTFAVVELVLKPLVLSFGSIFDLGLVLTSVGIGMVAGALVMTAWGGPRRKVLGILVFQFVEGSSLLVGGAQPSLVLLMCAAFAYGFVIPIVFGCARTIWQVKVPVAMQGRIAALRNGLVTLAIPLGYVVAASCSDFFEAAMMPNGALADSVGQAIGVGNGRGAGLLVVFMGALTLVAAVAIFSFGPYRRVETELFDEIPDAEGDKAASLGALEEC